MKVIFMQLVVTTTVGMYIMLKNSQNVVFLVQTNTICMWPMKTVWTRTFSHTFNN